MPSSCETSGWVIVSQLEKHGKVIFWFRRQLTSRACERWVGTQHALPSEESWSLDKCPEGLGWVNENKPLKRQLQIKCCWREPTLGGWRHLSLLDTFPSNLPLIQCHTSCPYSCSIQYRIPPSTLLVFVLFFFKTGPHCVVQAGLNLKSSSSCFLLHQCREYKAWPTIPGFYMFQQMLYHWAIPPVLNSLLLRQGLAV